MIRRGPAFRICHLNGERKPAANSVAELDATPKVTFIELFSCVLGAESFMHMKFKPQHHRLKVLLYSSSHLAPRDSL